MSPTDSDEQVVMTKNMGRVLNTFKQWDSTGDGLISEGDLRRILVTLGTPADDIPLLFADAAAGRSKDGNVNYEEFLAWLYGTSLISPATDGGMLSTFSCSSSSVTVIADDGRFEDELDRLSNSCCIGAGVMLGSSGEILSILEEPSRGYAAALVTKPKAWSELQEKLREPGAAWYFEWNVAEPPKSGVEAMVSGLRISASCWG
eukprot:gnl/MRDRNA2_/MRDRNA2_131314_c0_seq1.p1 gnl/MRDRNA2_/MRDRNA2_131314_c0~~gnl/MRDRNA2_/MRDRNA2_131314_c0_seq1.p1  ORF type:complete len:204 (-),score=33.73 gnl/MRDRNA2_/MRDRNA2_131314_c0_seq1:18-629(-)